MAIQVNVDNRNFLIPEQGDPCDLWTSYFAKLKTSLGKDNAKMVWLVTWNTNGSALCVANPKFKKWMFSNDLDVSNMATRTMADVSEIGGNLFGLGKSLTKILAIGVPVILAVVLVSIVIMLRNSTKNTKISDLALLTPVGRTAKLLGK